ncbi:hypothetical protein NGR_b10680 (plasmid) [Sinorhizobium fredii NGR234]|uniref:Uncharacterized protein n=1 Tax=Sinorhizobium fredii (strain NBRC 101917 / NGR234) TaxID=394 RepID=C3KR13_SINFN|nr:hypothetical protein [Sinorhizobium fredii]ACP22521.1 hypothetical protein NGR_b10680 [Sinorhizobium fredii NGR234]
MRELVFECCVLLENPTRFVEQMRLRLAGFHESTIDHGVEETFMFCDGYATARATDSAVLMRVVAKDLVFSHAIRIAFEETMLYIIPSAPEKVVWR